MADTETLDRLERWADKVIGDSERLSEGLPEHELREREASWYADFYALDGGWSVAPPDHPAMRSWLIEQEGMSSDFADQVLAKMRELVPAR
jgi:hypothetical protein